MAQIQRKISEEQQIMRQREGHTQAVRPGARKEGPWSSGQVICEQLIYTPPRIPQDS